MSSLLSVTLLMASLCQNGIGSQYANGVMERVIRTRQAGLTAKPLSTRLTPTDGYIAVLDCNAIGEIWTIHYENKSYSMLVVDCAGDAPTRQWMTRNNILVEVDFQFAKSVGKVGKAIKPLLVCKPIDKHD